ncbi:bifunctional ornithine acetyltransferase/N-acetylglutamate synthase [Geoglobus acetivorans]|uniref:Arginine biosynthesis bifunctional protein ArgJ n=1 Tax=Geoglobus acetivorans TaxID=565033 RepID=A0ABZ3H1J9_GEOAI|nr:bifunctional ornithine acetyltransferase/N-acetylglutamate synthase [Geoglobus acetivorans]
MDFRPLKCYGIKEGKYGVGVAVIDGKIYAVYTKNRIKAAPVIFNQNNLGERVKGIIVNSGNANAFTGEEGMKLAERMAAFLAEKLGCDTGEVAIASTGVIGVLPDMEKIEQLAEEVLKRLESSEAGVEAFAKAIMTTDKFPKISFREVGGVRVLGIAKGAGMIAPNMATMLAFIFTNAKTPEMDAVFRKCVDETFNRITVDGDTSTNDTVFLVTTEEAEIPRERFESLLRDVMLELAEMIVMDGEGATKLFHVHVYGAKSDEDADRVARAVANSLLVKTAIYGEDPNFGRIIAAAGYSGAEVDEVITLKLRSSYGEAVIVDRGRVAEGNIGHAERVMKAKKLEIVLDLHKGDGYGFAIGCDLTHDYVELNSAYTT